MSKKVVIVGGHGNVARRLTKLLTPEHSVTSIIRNPAQENDIRELSATPLLLSLADASVSEFTKAFQSADVVYFTAGAGARGTQDLIRKIDWEGAVKVFDAIEGVEGATKPLLILISSIDVRNPDNIPAHYNQSDIELSKQARAAMGYYMKCKYEADKNLIKRTAFKWIIIRPGALVNTLGEGTASVGRAHLARPISRDDVAKALALLIDREDAAGLAIDFVGGDVPIQDGLDAFIVRGVTDFLG